LRSTALITLLVLIYSLLLTAGISRQVKDTVGIRNANSVGNSRHSKLAGKELNWRVVYLRSRNPLFFRPQNKAITQTQMHIATSFNRAIREIL